MKKNIIFIGWWLGSMVLVGCSIAPPYIVMPPPGIIPLHINDQYGSIAPLATYFRNVAALPAEQIVQESEQAELAFKEKRGITERIKLAMLLGVLLPPEKRDVARAIRLLEMYTVRANTVTNKSLRDYAYGLYFLLVQQQQAAERENTLKERYNAMEADHKSLKERLLILETKGRQESENFKERYLALETKLREEASRNEALQLKLDTLKAIEESIRRRTK